MILLFKIKTSGFGSPPLIHVVYEGHDENTLMSHATGNKGVNEGSTAENNFHQFNFNGFKIFSQLGL